MHSIFGTLATFASLTILIFGLPTEIIKAHKTKKSTLSPALVCSAIMSYGLWAMYGFTKPDTFLQLSQTPGFVLMLIIAFQLWKYRKRR